MFGLGGEKYSKEAFGEAEKDVEAGNKYTVGYMSEVAGSGDIEKLHRAHDIIRKRVGAKEKLKKLLASGHAEAVKLNEEYDRLIKNADDAEEALRTFEETKLDM